MLADDLGALQRLADAGALTPEELASARMQVIAAFVAAAPPPAVPVTPANPPAPAPATGVPPRVPGVPSYFGKLPPRMVPVALATGAGIAGGVAAGEVIDGVAGAVTPPAGGTDGVAGAQF